MLARFQTKQPSFKFVEDEKYYWCFICLNEREKNEINEIGKVATEYLYDYNDFKISKENQELFQEIQNDPSKFLDYKPEKTLSLEEEVAQLKKENKILREQMDQITSVFNKLNI